MCSGSVLTLFGVMFGGFLLGLFNCFLIGLISGLIFGCLPLFPLIPVVIISCMFPLFPLIPKDVFSSGHHYQWSFDSVYL